MKTITVNNESGVDVTIIKDKITSYNMADYYIGAFTPPTEVHLEGGEIIIADITLEDFKKLINR